MFSTVLFSKEYLLKQAVTLYTTDQLTRTTKEINA